MMTLHWFTYPHPAPHRGSRELDGIHSLYIYWLIETAPPTNPHEKWQHQFIRPSPAHFKRRGDHLNTFLDHLSLPLINFCAIGSLRNLTSLYYKSNSWRTSSGSWEVLQKKGPAYQKKQCLSLALMTAFSPVLLQLNVHYYILSISLWLLFVE